MAEADEAVLISRSWYELFAYNSMPPDSFGILLDVAELGRVVTTLPIDDLDWLLGKVEKRLRIKPLQRKQARTHERLTNELLALAKEVPPSDASSTTMLGIAVWLAIHWRNEYGEARKRFDDLVEAGKAPHITMRHEGGQDWTLFIEEGFPGEPPPEPDLH